MKCPQCGLVNFKSAINCKRCNLVFDSGADPAHENAEAWRDSSHLVLRSDSFLPDRCVKCNSSTNITQKAHKLAYLPKHNLLLLLIGFIHYKAMMVPLALCSQHDSNRKKSLAAMVVMIILGLVGFFGGYAVDSMFLLFSGFGVFAGGFIVGTIQGSPVAIVKFDGEYMWLKGPGKEYLAGFPAWPSR